MMDSFFQDWRFAWRGLVRSPGFAAVAVVTLALGIGANSAIFTVVNAVVMRPLPYANADRLVRVTADFTGINATDVGLSQPELLDYRDRSGLFEGIAGVWAHQRQPDRDRSARSGSRRCWPVRRISTCSACGRSSDGCSALTTPRPASTRSSSSAMRSGIAASARRRTPSAASSDRQRLGTPIVGVLPPGFRHPGTLGPDRRGRVGAGQLRRPRHSRAAGARSPTSSPGAIARLTSGHHVRARRASGWRCFGQGTDSGVSERLSRRAPHGRPRLVSLQERSGRLGQARAAHAVRRRRLRAADRLRQHRQPAARARVHAAARAGGPAGARIVARPAGQADADRKPDAVGARRRRGRRGHRLARSKR